MLALMDPDDPRFTGLMFRVYGIRINFCTDITHYVVAASKLVQNVRPLILKRLFASAFSNKPISKAGFRKSVGLLTGSPTLSTKLLEPASRTCSSSGSFNFS